MDLEQYRQADSEKERLQDLLRLLPQGKQSLLEIGARDGYHSRLLTGHFETVTALDLEKPDFTIDRVVPVRGDVTDLQFPDNHFDCVLCAEVLEHIPAVEKAASEISRVARGEVIIGVPYRQDIRCAKLTCRACGKVNPPFGHVNTFDEERLRALFPRLRVAEFSFAGTNYLRTNAFSSWLMTAGGNPWGTYFQDEPCIHCGARLEAPASRSLAQKISAALAYRIDRWQRFFTKPIPAWIHVLFQKGSPAA